MNSRRVEKGNLEIDRLSSVPESLLIGILSRLEYKEAVKTAVLSKRWRFVWTDLPRVEVKETRSASRAVDFVNRMISVGRRDVVESFHVESRFEKRFFSDVNAWLEFAAANKVENLCVRLYAGEPMELLQRPLEWRCLKSLSLWRVRMCQDRLDNLVSGCPLLESLELIWCTGFRRLDVGNRSFRRLCVDQRIDERGSELVLEEVSAPYMRELEVSSVICIADNLHAPALHQATISLSKYRDGQKGLEIVLALFLLKDIRHVHKLDLRDQTALFISELAATFSNFQYFHPFSFHDLAISATEGHISGIMILLRSSPNLDNLLISCLNRKRVYFGRVENVGEFDCHEFLHLKFVDIAYFGSSTVKLAQTILNKAPALEQMVIRNTSSSSTNSRYFIDNCQSLLLYPKSSQKAKLLIHQ